MKRLKTVRNNDGSLYGYRFACPGCGDPHVIPTTGAHAWGFNGDVDRPAFTPSLLVRWRPADPGDAPYTLVCHSFVRDGRIEFLSDCTHAKAGQTVDLPDVPE